MEIEAKFALPNADILEHLQAIDRLAGFVLSAPQVKQMHDTYLDTSERTILSAGYACRRREREGQVVFTLKGLKGVEGAVHRREELEVSLPDDQPPAQWPASPARDRVLQLIGKARLIPLFDLHQTRVIRLLSQDERTAAELSLDDVYLAAQGREQAYLELEVELSPQGSEEELATIVACLQDEWGLEPEPRSKFERALTFWEGRLVKNELLTPQERAICEQVAARDDLYGRRAQGLLALDEGATQAEAGERASSSARTVRRWLVTFHQKRMDAFPAHVLDAIQPASAPPETILEEPPIEPEEPEEPSQPPTEQIVQPVPKKRPKKPPKKPGLEADDSMTEAARKTFYFHFQRMLYHEPGTRLGEDIEELHDMRVATRRMRSAFWVFGDHLDMEQWKPFLKGLKSTGRALGAVRDLDVFWEKTQHYLDTLPSERQNDLEPLRKVWEVEREKDRASMLVYLDGERFARFKEQFGKFLKKSSVEAMPLFSKKGDPLPHRLRHVVPVALYQRLADIRAYDEWVTGPDIPLERLHQLRIAAKRLRYTLEYFEEVLAPETKEVIKEIKGLQDHLGDLQDAVVASNLLRDFLTWGTWGHTQAKTISLPSEPIIAPGVAAYLTTRQIELQQLVETFPQVWTRFRGPEFSRSVALVTASL
jgi:CHAD domain-containing protein